MSLFEKDHLDIQIESLIQFCDNKKQELQKQITTILNQKNTSKYNLDGDTHQIDCTCKQCLRNEFNYKKSENLQSEKTQNRIQTLLQQEKSINCQYIQISEQIISQQQQRIYQQSIIKEQKQENNEESSQQELNQKLMGQDNNQVKVIGNTQIKNNQEQQIEVEQLKEIYIQDKQVQLIEDEFQEDGFMIKYQKYRAGLEQSITNKYNIDFNQSCYKQDRQENKIQTELDKYEQEQLANLYNS